MIRNLRKRSYRLSPVPAFWLHPVTFFDYFCMRNYKPLWWKAESSEITASGKCGTWNAHSSGNHSVCWLIHLPDGRITFTQSDGDRTREKSKRARMRVRARAKVWAKKTQVPGGTTMRPCVVVQNTHAHTHMCMHARGAHSHSYSLIHVQVFPSSFIFIKAFPTVDWWGGWTDGWT